MAAVRFKHGLERGVTHWPGNNIVDFSLSPHHLVLGLWVIIAVDSPARSIFAVWECIKTFPQVFAPELVLLVTYQIAVSVEHCGKYFDGVGDAVRVRC
jgi:hypothetical protein